jgi:integrase
VPIENDSHPAKRRERVKNHPGIYRRPIGAKKWRYEITYLDSTGRRRWQTTGDGLEQAVVALEEITGRKRRGEKVIPGRRTFEMVADEWVGLQTGLRPSTVASYRWAFKYHLNPVIGSFRISEVDEHAITREVIGRLQTKKKAASTINAVLSPLGRVLDHAVRSGEISSNPLRRLRRGERPRPTRRELVVLDSKEITKLLEKAPRNWHAFLATAVFTGLRIGELRGLTWRDFDAANGVLNVRQQLSRDGVAGPPKTAQGRRSVVLAPFLVSILRAHQLASSFSGRDQPIFTTPVGTPIDERGATYRGLRVALENAGIDRHLSLHDLRHTAASLMISQGANVVYVSHQLGHSSPTITLGTYARLFDHAEHSETMRDRMEAAFGTSSVRGSGI